MSKLSLKKLVDCAIIAAVYAASTMALGFMSYWPVQFRVSEALCILPFFAPYTAWGLFVGCAAANLVSFAGWMDVVFGSLATLLACSCMAEIGKRRGRDSMLSCVFACAMPVVWNSAVVGAVIAVVTATEQTVFWYSFAVNALLVGLGEAGVMYAVALPLMRWLPKTGYLSKMLAEP